MNAWYSAYDNPADNFDLEVDLSNGCQLIRNLKSQKALLILTVSDKVGLDLHIENDSSIWLEIYQPDAYTPAFVTKQTAEEVLTAAARNFDGKSPTDCIPALKNT